MIDKYILSLLLTLVVGPVVGYFVHKWRIRNDLDAGRERAPFELFQKTITAREFELTKARESMEGFIKLHLDQDREERIRDRAERDKLVEVLTGTRDALGAIKDELVVHRQEERERTSTLHDRLNDIHKDLWASRGGLSPGTHG